MWYSGRPWLEYSRTKDAAYCYPCRKFCLSNGKADAAFVTSGFNNWKAATIANKGLSKHEKSKQHELNMICWSEKTERQRANKEVSTMVNSEQLARNRYVSSIIGVIHFLAANELPHRGSVESAPSLDDDVDEKPCGLFLSLFE
jgi:hypothetical protein